MLLIFSLALPHLSVAQNPNELLLKNYRPSSIYRTPQTKVEKASFPLIDMHAHPYVKSEEEPDDWIKTMDELNIDKSVILTHQTSKTFDSFYHFFGQEVLEKVYRSNATKVLGSENKDYLYLKKDLPLI